MISGAVNPRHEITIRLAVMDSLGRPRDIVAVLYTGNTGDLTLLAAVIGALGLTWVNYAQVVLGNGQVAHVDEYEATIIWDGRPRPIQVQIVEAMPLIGMRLLIGHDLRARVVSGGAVEIEAVP